MKIIIIVAKGKNNVIGKNNDLMWYLPRDMQFFKEVTSGHSVLMGRKNYESIPENFRPLENRLNVVLSCNQNYPLEKGVLCFNGLKKALNALKKTMTHQKCFIIGGGEIYRQALGLEVVDEMYITEVDFHQQGDVYFPTVDFSLWQEETVFKQEKNEQHAYDFEVFRYLPK